MDTDAVSVSRGGPIDRQTLVRGVADVIVVALFVIAGLVSHDISPISDPIATVQTTIPFVVGWLVVAPLAGVYTGHRRSIGGVTRVTTVAWIGAANVGLILRSSPLFDGGALWPFNLIMTGLGLIVIVGWRVALATLVSSDGSP